MFRFTYLILPLVIAGLSSCSLARHGGVTISQPRINWPRSDLSRYDFTYAAHNYNYPNKAAVAHRLAGPDGVPVRYPQPGLKTLPNDRMPQPGTPPIGGWVLEHRLADDLAGRPYKMPRLVRPLAVPQPNRRGQPVAGERTEPGPAPETLNRRPVPGYANPVSPVSNFN